MTVQWWCAARGVPWTWSWQAYPGIWLFVAAIGAVGTGLLSTSRESNARGWGRWLGFGAGVVVLWAALDWPLGPLGAGYLLTAHTLQYLAMTGLAAPLLLGGLQPAMAARRGLDGSSGPLLDRLTQPLVAALVFNAVLIGTHVAAVVDRLLVSPSGTFLMDVVWLGSGLLFWWPVMVGRAGMDRLVGPAGVLYLFLGGIPSHGVGALLTLATYPLYGLYELTPRAVDISARADQQLAGVIMWVGAPLVSLVAMSIRFVHWVRSEDDLGVDPAAGSDDHAPSSHTPAGSVSSQSRIKEVGFMAMTDARRMNQSAAFLLHGNLDLPSRRGRAWVGPGPLVVALALTLVPGPVWAHATLVRSTPAQRAMLVRPPDRVRLWFSEPLEAKFAAVSVWDASGKQIDQQDGLVGPEDPKALSVGVPTLGPGTYTVKYRVLSVDGHVVEGSFRFTLRPSP